MLARLTVSNFGLVERQEVSFGPGLTVITGETGAGKSLLVGALGFLLGEKASAEMVRSGASKAAVEGLFAVEGGEILKLLSEAGIETEVELILRRELAADGASRAYVNDRSVTATLLRRLGEMLVDFHGQHEHQSLLAPSNHRGFFDAAAVSKQALLEVQRAYSQLKEKQAAGEAFCSQRQLSPEEAELLSFQLQEIKAAGLSEGEEEKLLAEKKVLENVEKLQIAARNVLGILDEGEGAARLQILMALKELRRGEALDSALADWAGRLDSVSAEVSEIIRELERYRSNLAASPERLSEVLDRLDLYQKLKRKYGGSVGAVLEFAEAAGQKLSAASTQKADEEKLRAELSKSGREYLSAARKLSALRQKEAPRFVSRLLAHLKELALKDTVFEVRFGLKEAREGIDFDGKTVAYDESGFDQIEFFFSANPGEPPKPLARTASGGELSRLMLALKLLSSPSAGFGTSSTDKVGTLVFDEIDQGLGGETAYRVGEKLLEASKNYQIFCITHLQQIAALGNAHLLVSKEKAGSRYAVRVEALTEVDRKAEIARMLAGTRAGAAALKQAEEMLQAKPDSKRSAVLSRDAKTK